MKERKEVMTNKYKIAENEISKENISKRKNIKTNLN